MATTPKINCLDNDRESLKNALPKELTEKLKYYVNTHATSESSKRLEALEKAFELNTSIQASRFDDLREASRHSLALYLAKKKSEYNAINAGYDALLSKTSSIEAASKALLSLNLYPTKSFESRLKNINYPTSIEQALARDWQSVGNDLWKSYLTVFGNQLSDNDE